MNDEKVPSYNELRRKITAVMMKESTTCNTTQYKYFL